MISPGRGLRVGVREEEGREGGAKEEKEEMEESNSPIFLFLGVVVEREGRGMAGEGFVADPRTENDESRVLSVLCFGVIVEYVAGLRIPDTAGFPILLELPAAVGVFLLGICKLVLTRSTLGFGLLVGIWKETSKFSPVFGFTGFALAFLGIPDSVPGSTIPDLFESEGLGMAEGRAKLSSLSWLVVRGRGIEVGISFLGSVVSWNEVSRLDTAFLGSVVNWKDVSRLSIAFLVSVGRIKETSRFTIPFLAS